MRTVKDHRAGTLTISNTDRRKRILDEQEANFLAVELVNILKIENLGINLANKKIYQLIDNVNRAEYYYDQAKDQCL